MLEKYLHNIPHFTRVQLSWHEYMSFLEEDFLGQSTLMNTCVHKMCLFLFSLKVICVCASKLTTFQILPKRIK